MLESMTDRQREIFILYGEGKDAAEIADLLFLSKKTVWSHKQYAMEKWEINSHQYMYFAIKHHIQKEMKL